MVGESCFDVAVTVAMWWAENDRPTDPKWTKSLFRRGFEILVWVIALKFATAAWTFPAVTPPPVEPDLSELRFARLGSLPRRPWNERIKKVNYGNREMTNTQHRSKGSTLAIEMRPA